jgi:LmbE family N-acetylglucosaminyl deacetylase
VKDLFVIAHPDDEAMVGQAIAASHDPFVVVATNGEDSTIDMCGNRFCPVR